MANGYQIRDQFAAHFLTFTVVGWADVFSRKELRDIAIDSLRFCRENKNLEIYGYVIMTNHIHVIFKSENGDLSGIVRDFKKYTAKQAFKWIEESGRESRKDWLEWVFKEKAKTNKRTKIRQFWTHYNHAVELDTNHKADIRLNYIHQNPVKAGWVDKPEEYLYSSARNYAGLESVIDIDLM